MSDFEIWKDIEGYEGLYQVSNLGRVKNLKRIDAHEHELQGRILKPCKTKNGYLHVNLSKDGKTQSYYVHRLVATAFIENPNNYKEVNHIDEKPINNELSNLEWCDRKYNCNFGTRNKRKGESMRGEKHYNAKQLYFLEAQKLYSCAKSASEDLSINYYTLATHLQGKTKTCSKNRYHFIYVQDFLNKAEIMQL